MGEEQISEAPSQESEMSLENFVSLVDKPTVEGTIALLQTYLKAKAERKDYKFVLSMALGSLSAVHDGVFPRRTEIRQ